jgi:citrate/tricarballylate utilization protein
LPVLDLLPDPLKEAERQMVICNACRYCLGYCAVFPAMERRESFARKDLLYLANLCFDCRDCYYACPYAPPHEFAVNVPKVFAQLRTETYRAYARPLVVARLFRQNGWAVASVSTAAVATMLLLVLVLRGPSVLFATHLGEGAFYAVIPFAAMTLVASVLFLSALGALGVAFVRFWWDTHGSLRELADLRALGSASWDALRLTYLKARGAGCSYPRAQLSHLRRRLHHLVFYGFLLDFASTTVAAVYSHVLDWQAPYPLLSLPVLLGTLGGLMLVIGAGGLLGLKRGSDRELEDRTMRGMDVSFLVLLFLTSFTGLLLLALRETRAMGPLLAVHLGTVAGLFLTWPYGKFAHVVFRYAALLENSIEQHGEGGEAASFRGTEPAES